MSEMDSQLTVLGATVRAPLDHVEVFAAPRHVVEVRLTSDELSSVCPVTSQPDLSSVEITYQPDGWCVETKSLKLYLWGFRQRPIFAEALAVEIADEIMTTAQPHRVSVVLTQRPRGGIVVAATAERQRSRADGASASEPGGDGVWGRSPQGDTAERQRSRADGASASEPGGDGVWGRSPQGDTAERQRSRADGASASEPGGDGVWGRSPQGDTAERQRDIARLTRP